MLRDDNLLHKNLEGYQVTGKSSMNALKSTFFGESISATTSSQRVVIEFLYAARTSEQQTQQNILQKISALQEIHHPHILPILAFGIYKDVPYLITEQLKSGSLYERLWHLRAGKPMQREEAKHTLAQVGSALYYAHQCNIIHGYLNPQAVLFDLKRDVLLTGFHHHALSLPDEVEDINSQEAGIYRAPEQLTGTASEKSDQYALGCIAYTMFTGQKPFMVPSISKPGTFFRTKSLVAPRKLNPDLPEIIEEALLKALSREPGQRFQDILAFLSALGIASVEKENVGITVGIFEQTMLARSTHLQLSPLATIDNFETVKTSVPSRMTNANIIHPSTFKKSERSTKPQTSRVLVLVASLVAIIVIFATMWVTLNVSTATKRADPPSATQITSAVDATTQTSLPQSTATTSGTPSSPSGTTIPGKNTTPQPGGHTLNPTPSKNPTPTTPGGVPTTIPTTVPTTTPTPVQVSLGAFFNDKGIGAAPGQANFDGSKFAYPASKLPMGGQITIQGITYQFPGAGANDNIIVSGQTLSLTPGHYQQAFLLTSSSWGSVSGTITIQYTDGSTSTVQITVPDWISGSSGTLSTPYRYNPTRIDYNTAYIYAIPISLDPTRVANALLFPTTLNKQYSKGQMHVFALTLQP